MSKSKRVMIIDALNAYLRAYIVDPSLSMSGNPIGGIKGFFKILQKLVREIKPDEILIIWDGPNGSSKRKAIDKNYKAGRKPLRLTKNAPRTKCGSKCGQWSISTICPSSRLTSPGSKQMTLLRISLRCHIIKVGRK